MTDQAPYGAIKDDDDNPTWTKEDFARARPAEELPPEVLSHFPNTLKRMGRPPSENRKEAVNLRLDPEVLAAWRASGPGWQTRMGEVLRGAMPKAG